MLSRLHDWLLYVNYYPIAIAGIFVIQLLCLSEYWFHSWLGIIRALWHSLSPLSFAHHSWDLNTIKGNHYIQRYNERSWIRIRSKKKTGVPDSKNTQQNQGF